VLDPVLEHLRREAEIGGYEAAHAAQERLEAVYGSIARLVNCDPGELAIVDSATRAWDTVFYGLRLAPGDRILTSAVEYASNYLAFLHAGMRIDVVPSDAHGQLDVDALERMLDERVRLIAVTHVPTNGGLVNPAAAIGRLARAHGIPFLLDACQSVGQLPVDVQAIGCDFLSATGRKFLRGPRGTGFLYVRRERLDEIDPPSIDLHAARWTARDEYELRPDARRFEGWESNVAAKLGLGAAADYANAWGIDAIWRACASWPVRCARSSRGCPASCCATSAPSRAASSRSPRRASSRASWCSLCGARASTSGSRTPRPRASTWSSAASSPSSACRCTTTTTSATSSASASDFGARERLADRRRRA
jgi:selenocysteine lyase/cysteine desulfurase